LIRDPRTVPGNFDFGLNTNRTFVFWPDLAESGQAALERDVANSGQSLPIVCRQLATHLSRLSPSNS
jgi:hypothetical protein